MRWITMCRNDQELPDFVFTNDYMKDKNIWMN